MNRTIQRIVGIFAVLSLTMGLFTPAGASSVSIPHAAGNTYYVSVSGSDLNNCTQSAPCKSFNKAMSLIQSGDVLYVMPGTYNQTLTISKSGTASAPISVIGNGASIDLKGSQPNGIKIGGNYINVTGFDVRNTVSHAVLIGGKHIKFENSSVHHSVMENGSGTCSGSGGWGSGVKVMVGGENVTIRGNSVYENCGEGIAVTRGVNVLVDNNTVRDNFSVNIYIDNSYNTVTRNNTSACTGIYLRNGSRPAGIVIAEEEYSGWGTQRRDNQVVGNTVMNCHSGIVSWESELSNGKEIRLLVDGNKVSGTIGKYPIGLMTVNDNVVIRNNSIDKPVYVRYPAGVKLENNLIGGVLPTATNLAAPATATRTPVPIITQSWTSTPSATHIWTSTPTTMHSPTPTLTVSPVETSTTQPPALPTATPDLSGKPEDETVFDDKDGRFVYSSGWKDIDAAQAYNSSYKSNSKYGASITFDFVGETFGILYTDGSSYRRMSVYIDDVLVETIYRSTSKTRYQKRWDYPGVLSPGVHTLKLVFANGNGTFDAVIVRSLKDGDRLPLPTPILPPATSTPFVIPTFTNTAVPPTALSRATPVPPSPGPSVTPEPSKVPESIKKTPAEKIFDDKDGAFLYSDGWTDVRKREAHGDSYKMTDQNGAFVTFAFTGVSFSVIYLSESDFNSIDVYVDNVLVGTIKDSGKSRTIQKRWDYSGKLEPGVHTLKLVFNLGRSRNSSGTLDAVIVR